MKKIISFILILTILLSFSSCIGPIQMDEIYFNSVNYNNLYDTYDTFWSDGKTTFYNSDGFYNQRLFVNHNGKKLKLFENNDFSEREERYDGNFQAINDFGYFETADELSNADHIYKYSFADRKYEKIFSTKNMSTWIATTEFIAFKKWIDTDDTLYDLYVYDIKSKNEILIRKGVLEFGIVDNKIRYVLPTNTDTYSVFEYDTKKSTNKNLGSFNASITYEYPVINFTKDFITISQLESDVIVYSIGDKTAKYILPKPINQFIAGEKFAYAICYKEDEYGGAKNEKGTGLYKIDLSNGKYQRLPYDINSDTEIRVASDDEIYILQGNFHGFLFKNTAYKINVSENTKKRLFLY